MVTPHFENLKFEIDNQMEAIHHFFNLTEPNFTILPDSLRHIEERDAQSKLGLPEGREEIEEGLQVRNKQDGHHSEAAKRVQHATARRTQTAFQCLGDSGHSAVR